MLEYLALFYFMHETFVESCLSTSGATNKYEQIYEFRRMQENLGPRIIIDDEAQV
uniref:Uncharacterized protein n=1 Tax=Ascaris lumbricoides TaxID=6252 RepID=A0A0M3IJX4_ASCLU